MSTLRPLSKEFVAFVDRVVECAEQRYKGDRRVRILIGIALCQELHPSDSEKTLLELAYQFWFSGERAAEFEDTRQALGKADTQFQRDNAFHSTESYRNMIYAIVFSWPGGIETDDGVMLLEFAYKLGVDPDRIKEIVQRFILELR